MGDVVAGLLTGLSLIVAIGAQNAFVLRQGLRRSHVGLVVAVCAVSDVVLIVAGVAGIGVLVDRAAWAVEVVRWLGVAFLTAYGVSSLLRARKPQVLAAGDGAVEARGVVLLKAAALTWPCSSSATTMRRWPSFSPPRASASPSPWRSPPQAGLVHPCRSPNVPSTPGSYIAYDIAKADLCI